MDPLSRVKEKGGYCKYNNTADSMSTCFLWRKSIYLGYHCATARNTTEIPEPARATKGPAMKAFFVDMKLAPAGSRLDVTAEDLEKINGLKKNGPLRAMTIDDVIVRRMIILGTEPTTKLSIHPEGECNGKTLNTLSELARLIPGAPMLEGHRKESVPWGRCFDASVVDETGYKGKVLAIKFYFVKNEEGLKREQAIDAGILAEGSISYFFDKARCSICHKEIAMVNMWGMCMTSAKCGHQIGKKDSVSGLMCYWYPVEFKMVGEISYVYRGAYQKSKSMLAVPYENALEMAYEEDQIEGGKELERMLTEGGGLTYEEEKSEAGEAEKPEPAANTAPEGSGAGTEHADGILTEEETKAVDAMEGNLDDDEMECSLREMLPAEKFEAGKARYREKNPAEGKKYCIDCGCTEGEEQCARCGGILIENDAEVEHSETRSECPNPECDAVEKANGKCVCGTDLVLVDAGLGKPVGRVKPAKAGITHNEFFDIEEFSNLPGGAYYIEPKYDGVWIEAHKDGETVKMFTDRGNEVSEKFPAIAAEIVALKVNNIVIAGEMVRYRGRQRLGHSDVSAWIHSKQESYADKDFRFKPFDVMYCMGESVRTMPLKTRRAMLNRNVTWGKQVHPTPVTRLEHKKGDDKIVRTIRERATREGTMIKNEESTYDRAGEKQLYKWKRQQIIDAIVEKISKKETGVYVYTCGVGTGNQRQTIGDTYATSVEAKHGDIISVSVDKVVYDEGEKKFSWHVPKVVGLRDDREAPDSIETLRKLAKAANADNGIRYGKMAMLGEVVPKLLRVEHEETLWLVGGIVEHGISTNDVDILAKNEISSALKAKILKELGERLAEMVEWLVDAEGPKGPYIQIDSCMSENAVKGWKFAKKFVLQEHGWGKKKHYDLRFGAPKTPRMWGWTCFKEPTKIAGGEKVRCQEKKYHDPKWMEVNKRSIKPGEEGNPTKNLMAWMLIVDSGEYEYIRRTADFLEVVLHGKKWSGRYVFRKINVKKVEGEHVDGDETGTKSESIWIMWKPMDQAVKSPMKKLIVEKIRNVDCFWESNDEDVELNLAAEISPEEEGSV